jgi:putative heme-binding domain-containing protein
MGVPSDPPNNKNVARLKLVSGDKTIAEAYPPRKDTPHKVNWKLDQYAGQQAYLEFTDGDIGNAYAWFAFAKLDPEVVPMPYPAPMALQQRLRFAATAAGESKIASVAEPLRTMMTTPALDTETRAAAASALVAINDSKSVEPMAQLVSDVNEIMPLRQKMAAALGAMPAGRETAVSSFRFAPAELQTALAQAMTTDKAGGEALLTAVQEGKAPARVLLVQQVHDRLAALGIADVDKRVKGLTKGVAAPKEDLEKLLAERRAAYRSASKLSAEAGQQVFAKNCAACHQIDGKGGQVGPQLAGLSKRGVDRLIEDILDPNRNVDPAFRYSNIFLKDGHVVTGLQKREEGEVLIFVDSTAKEIPVKKSDIKQRFESPGSLMVSNFSEIISPSDFNNLLAYLLTK